MALQTPESLRAQDNHFPVQIDDESLRDGLQDDAVHHPTPEQAVVLFELMRQLGTHRADIGFAAAGHVHLERIQAIARYNHSLPFPLEISCAARMIPSDITPIIELREVTGAHFWVDAFLGTDPTRIAAEGWEVSQMIDWVKETTHYAVDHGLDVMLVTETTIDGIKKIPGVVEQLYLTGLSEGAKRVCLCDTTGSALPNEVQDAVLWMKGLLDHHGFPEVKIDFHGHNDLGCAIANSVAALTAGAQRVHATILGIGERCGNADRTALQLQLRRTGLDEGAYNLTFIPEYVKKASEIFGIPIPDAYPGIGEQSRFIVSGIHAAAVLKAKNTLSPEEADSLYLPVDYHHLLGVTPSHIVKIGPLAGKANVYLWSAFRGIDVSDEQVLRILERAKEAQRTLTDTEIFTLIE